MYICISVAIRWTLQAPQSLSVQGCLSGAFSFRHLSSGGFAPPRLPHFSLVFLFACVTLFSVVSGQPQLWICSGLALAGSASQAAVEWLMPLSKITHLVPKVQRGGTFCEQRGAGGAVQASTATSSPLLLPELPAQPSPGQPDPAHCEPLPSPSLFPGFQRDRPGCQC